MENLPQFDPQDIEAFQKYSSTRDQKSYIQIQDNKLKHTIWSDNKSSLSEINQFVQDRLDSANSPKDLEALRILSEGYSKLIDHVNKHIEVSEPSLYKRLKIIVFKRFGIATTTEIATAKTINAALQQKITAMTPDPAEKEQEKVRELEASMSNEARATFQRLTIPSGIKKSTIMKATIEAFKILKPEMTGTRFSIEGYNFVVLRENDQTVNLFIQQEGLIGKGGFGKLQKIGDLRGQKDLVMKTANPKLKGDQLLDLDNDKKMVDKIQERLREQGLSTTGFPKAYRVVNLSSSDASKIGLVLQRANHGALFDYRLEKTLTDEEKIELAYYLVSVLDALSQIGIIHGDIKPENILLHKEDDGSYSLILIDFGGSVDTWETLKEIVNTPSYSNPTLLAKYKSSMNTMPQSAPSAGKKNDVFAMASTIYAMIKGVMPYSLDDKGYPQLDKRKKPILNQDLVDGTDPLNKILHKMLSGQLFASEAKDEIEKLRSKGKAEGISPLHFQQPLISDDSL